MNYKLYSLNDVALIIESQGYPNIKFRATQNFSFVSDSDETIKRYVKPEIDTYVVPDINRLQNKYRQLGIDTSLTCTLGKTGSNCDWDYVISTTNIFSKILTPNMDSFFVSTIHIRNTEVNRAIELIDKSVELESKMPKIFQDYISNAYVKHNNVEIKFAKTAHPSILEDFKKFMKENSDFVVKIA
jgi:hypothetical protein